ncbi:unnamed protein product, partial [Polarella glacialis]
SWCERELAKHVSCVKDFLRDARSHDQPYMPGSNTEHDRCTTTRQEYVDCVHGPRTQPEARYLPKPMASTQAMPLDHYKQQSVMGPVAQQPESGPGSKLPQQPSKPTDSKPPPPCEMELSIHGQCVEHAFRNAITKGQDYIFLSSNGQDRCFGSRTSFEKCLKTHKEMAAGTRAAIEADPWESPRLADHFSVLGRWLK